MSIYLQPADYTTYGVPSATAAQVQQASAFIDAHLGRPDGLIWVPDGNGYPAYMQGKVPRYTFAAQGSISAGQTASVAISGPVGQLQVGDCILIDRANSAITEVVQISAISGNVVTLGTTAANQPNGVQFNHAAGCLLEMGMLIDEQRYLPKGRSTVILSSIPAVRVIGGTGRYAYGRRGDAGAYNGDEFNLMAALNKFGGPPAWEIWPANTAAGVDERTGELWVPAGIMLAYYSEVRVRYVAGFQYADLPQVVKMACAQIISALSQDPGLGNAQTFRAGDTQVQRFAATILTDDVKAQLQPYASKGFA